MLGNTPLLRHGTNPPSARPRRVISARLRDQCSVGLGAEPELVGDASGDGQRFFVAPPT
jgi:hypothetical protein